MPDKFGMYSYYDTPEGQDGAKKALYLAKWGSLMGLTACGWTIIVEHRPTGLPLIVGKMITWAVPAALMGAAFGSAAYFGCRLRKKDDAYNHLFGGVAAGAVLGGRLKSVKSACFWMLALGSVAALNKYCVLQGWDFISQKYKDEQIWKNRHRGGVFQWQSKLNEPYWTKSEK